MNSFDINYQLLKQQHPYYSSGLCSSSRFINETCEESKYDLLQVWVYPELSISQIKDKFPRISFDDVVKLSLVYNPIPESSQYYDNLTLFYHSCKMNQENPQIFLDKILLDSNRPKNKVNETPDSLYAKYLELSKPAKSLNKRKDTNEELTRSYSVSVCMICYKFNRKDVLSFFTSNKYFDITLQMLNAKDGKEFKTMKRWDTFVSESDFERIQILNAEEMLEFITIYGLIYKDGSAILNIIKKHYYSSLINVIGKDKSESIVSKYVPNFELSEAEYPFEPNLIKYSRLSEYIPVQVGICTIGQALFVLGAIEKVIPKEYLGIFYSTSGKFDLYFNWLKENGDINEKWLGKELDNESPVNMFICNNIYGFVSRNRFLYGDEDKLSNLDVFYYRHVYGKSNIRPKLADKYITIYP